MAGQSRLVELQIGSEGQISKRFWLAAPPPCGQLRDAGADETWLARHGRSEFSETDATETGLARHSEACRSTWREVDPWESQQLGDVEMIAVPFPE